MSQADALYAAVMLRGTVRMTDKVHAIIKNLRLSGGNRCVLVPADDTYKGMLQLVSGYVTWGEINEKTLTMLLEKRGHAVKKKAKSLASKALRDNALNSELVKSVFRLSPPSGGLRAVRRHYPKGDTGYRGTEINQLLMRMI